MEKEKEKEKKKYPIGSEHYTLYEEVGNGASASVHRALCVPLNEIVAIKILDFERSNCDLNNISREAQTMVLVYHPNVLKSHCSFVNDHTLWVIMPYMAGGSCLHILKAAHPDGFEEVVIATILREVLKGLHYLHEHGHIHRDVKAGNILIDPHGGIKLGDFGVSACLFDSGDRQQRRNTFVGTPCWMAPEVMEQLHGYDCKADIWSFGITALELAHGHAPFSKYPPMKVLLMTLQNAPPGLDYERDKKFSKSFKEMITSCLVKDPSKRPSAKKLLKHSFFKQARSNDYIARTLLDGLPPLGDLLQELKKKEEDMLAQKKMPDGQKEEISQNEYKRGISSWNFDVEDMKAQASLIDDDVITEKDEEMAIKLQHQSSLSKNTSVLQRQSSYRSQHSDAVHLDDNAATSTSPVGSATNLAKTNGEVSVSGAKVEQPSSKSSLGIENHAVINLEDKSISGSIKRSSELSPPGVINQSDKVPNQSRGGPTIIHTQENVQTEITSKASKTSGYDVANGDEGDEKVKSPMVQQKGRFKITSESVEMEKAAPAAVLHKSQSMQVLPQNQAHFSSSPSDATSSNSLGHVLFPSLQSILQTNILQRDNILHLMKKATLADCSGLSSLDTGSMPLGTTVSEKSLLEAAHEREKELLREISDLQWRLVCVQEELQRYKTEDHAKAKS